LVPLVRFPASFSAFFGSLIHSSAVPTARRRQGNKAERDPEM
jgi:hypothetical protein